VSDSVPLDQQTVTVRVQVIDMQSFTLDLTLPTYLPAKDVTQRIARDAGLDAYDAKARRRNFWMRARGRLVQEHETLADLGVVNRELVYLLPEPPPGTGVEEQIPDYPTNRGYAAKGTGALVASLLGLISWAVLWGATLTVDRSFWTVTLPGLAMGFICTGLSRHMWGGQGRQARIVATALGLFVLMFAVVFLPAILQGERAAKVYSESIFGFVIGISGVIFGWIAWWGAVEPLPGRDVTEEQEDQRQQALEEVPCGICGQGVNVDVREECPYRCGRTFHTGCIQARLSVYRGDDRFCAICNAVVG
jgi:uncharacterized ubiquitin-like protein YukD